MSFLSDAVSRATQQIKTGVNSQIDRQVQGVKGAVQ